MDLFQLYADAGRTGLLVALAGQPLDKLNDQAAQGDYLSPWAMVLLG